MEQNTWQPLIGEPPASQGMIGQHKQVLQLLPPSCDFPTAPRKECKAGMSQEEQNVHVFIDFHLKTRKCVCVCVHACNTIESWQQQSVSAKFVHELLCKGKKSIF